MYFTECQQTTRADDGDGMLTLPGPITTVVVSLDMGLSCEPPTWPCLLLTTYTIQRLTLAPLNSLLQLSGRPRSCLECLRDAICSQ